MTCTRRILLALLCSFLTVAVFAQDVDDHQGVSNVLGAGARAWGMGGAFIALADDATAASWNPAGLAQLVKPEVSLVLENGKGALEWKYRYVTRQANLTQVDESIRDTGATDYAGISFASGTYPFRVGSGRDFVAQFSYRRLSTFPGILNAFLTGTTVTNDKGVVIKDEQNAHIYETEYQGGFSSYAGSFAAPVTKKMKLGLTANYIRGDVSSMATAGGGVLPNPVYQGLSYAFSGISFDLGGLYAPTEKWSIGAVYHTGFNSPFWYQSTSQMSGTDPIESGGRTSMRWPNGYGAGVAWKPTEFLTIESDASVTHWGDATVDEVKISDLTYSAENGYVPEVSTYKNLGFPYFGVQQRDTTTVRLGAEYVFFYHDVTLPVRLGAFRESQATNAWDDTGDLQKQPRYSGYTAGLGMSVGRVQVDLAYVRTTGTDYGRSGVTSGNTTADYETASVINQRLILSALYRF